MLHYTKMAWLLKVSAQAFLNGTIRCNRKKYVL